jgi:hypothetical protein
MSYGATPKANALRKCTGWFPGVYNPSAYAPVVPLDGQAAAMGDVAPNTVALATLTLSFKGVLFCLFVTFIVSYVKKSRQRLPPQPRPLPIIGNLFQLADKKWLYSQECKERFSEYRTFI